MTKERAAELLSRQPEATKQGLPDVGVCIQCLASYNNGIHHFQWVDLEALIQEGESLDECIAWVMETSPTPGAEEWIFSDSSGLPSFLQGESVDARLLWAYAQELHGVMEHHKEAYKACCDQLAWIVDAEKFEEALVGEGRVEDFVEEFFDESELPDWVAQYVDWDALAADLKLNGDLFEAGDWVFRGGVL